MGFSAGKNIQIFDLEQKQKLKSHVATEEVTFWKWINAETIGIITENSVYHWSLTGCRRAIRPLSSRPTALS
jgi:clathrin heavy chain